MVPSANNVAHRNSGNYQPLKQWYHRRITQRHGAAQQARRSAWRGGSVTLAHRCK